MRLYRHVIVLELLMRNERTLTSNHVRWHHSARQGLLRRLEDILVDDDS